MKMPIRAKHWLITRYWLSYYLGDVGCTLCGNHGIIDTRGVSTAAGVPVGRINFCICPNGQEMRRTAQLRGGDTN